MRQKTGARLWGNRNPPEVCEFDGIRIRGHSGEGKSDRTRWIRALSDAAKQKDSRFQLRQHPMPSPVEKKIKNNASADVPILIQTLG